VLHTDILRIDVAYIDAVAVVTVQGDIDAETAPTLRVALEQLDPQQDVYVDMARVRFMDSSGVKVLVTQAKRIQANGELRLRIRNPSRVVRRIVELAALSEHFFEPEPAQSDLAAAV
jgi:anti-anti-sigma factor